MKIVWHLGLGDAIACAAIVAKLATENNIVEIPCWKHNEISVKSFFVNHPNVKVIPFEDESSYLKWMGSFELTDLCLGYYSRFPQLQHEDFVQWFYRQARMNIEKKGMYCPIEKAANQGRMYISTKNIIYHDDSERGFVIKNKKHNSVSLYRGEFSILTYHNLLLNAKEIHCIDSSFLHLVECLPTTGKLFYHKYARPNSPDYKYLKKEWQILN